MQSVICRRRFLIIALAALAVLFGQLPQQAHAAPAKKPVKKINVLIVTGFDVGSHKWKERTDETRKLLEKTGRFTVKVSESVEAFETLSTKDYDVVVLNYGFWKAPDPSDKGKQGLLDYVKGGGSLVANHFACSSFQKWDEYAELLGRVWKKGVGGHGPKGKFTVKIRDKDHPITKGLKAFETDDELYAKLSGAAAIEVLATAYSDWSKNEEPIVFVKKYGQGRVVHNVLGHDRRAREIPAYRTLLIRSVEWAATGKVAGQ
ncbi:MAG: ThuA domain-containing protein [Planctomycetes bacterium]|nr:ThuA domain-containing protein [Planctomycetota bacterium]